MFPWLSLYCSLALFLNAISPQQQTLKTCYSHTHQTQRLGIRTAPLIESAFFPTGSHQNVANNFLGLIKLKKKKKLLKSGNKTSDSIVGQRRLLSSVFSIILHEAYKHHLIQILRFTVDRYCSVSLIFHPSFSENFDTFHVLTHRSPLPDSNVKDSSLIVKAILSSYNCEKHSNCC